MALFILFLFFLTCFSFLLGSDSINNSIGLYITSSSSAGSHPNLSYKVDSTLNLTCSLTNQNFNKLVEPGYSLEWFPPSKTINSVNRLIFKRGSNYLNLIMHNLRETDSGDYKCRVRLTDDETFHDEVSVRINVKRKKDCPDTMFQCSPGNCIAKRYQCDGYQDCLYGEDETENNCGPGDACENKLKCADNRCIPLAWCCDILSDNNCTAKVRPMCCRQLDRTTYGDRDLMEDGTSRHYDSRLNDMGFLQTTVYTVIGCAMAFMFIVTILVIAICRVHMKRTLLSRCPVSTNRGDHSSGVHSSHINTIPFCDLYRSQYHNNDMMSTNPLLVTYNINNGVQFVGKPVDPPPYCEIVASPPREGPPPPYVSHENLAIEQSCENECRVLVEVQNEERVSPEANCDSQVEEEQTEDDALLGATSLNNAVSVISSKVTENNGRDLRFESVRLHDKNRKNVKKYQRSFSHDLGVQNPTTDEVSLSYKNINDIIKTESYVKKTKQASASSLSIDKNSKELVGESSCLDSTEDNKPDIQRGAVKRPCVNNIDTEYCDNINSKNISSA